MKNLFNINVCRRGALLIPLLSIEAREVVLCPSRAAFGAGERVLTQAATATNRVLTHTVTGGVERVLTQTATTG